MTFNEIRKLSAKEVPLLLPLARSFYAEGNLSGSLNETHFVKELKTLIENGTCFVLVGGMPIQGGIGGIIYKDLMTGDITCMETFWYVSNVERGFLGLRLLSAWEEEAIRIGAVKIIMAHLCSETSKKFTKLFEHRGYKIREQIFVREVAK